jgi:hypothetical protein
MYCSFLGFLRDGGRRRTPCLVANELLTLQDAQVLAPWLHRMRLLGGKEAEKHMEWSTGAFGLLEDRRYIHLSEHTTP